MNPMSIEQTKFVEHNAIEILQRLYNSEINYSLGSPGWDIGFLVRTGISAADENDFVAEEWISESPRLASIAIWTLAAMTAREIPDSDFSRWWNKTAPAGSTLTPTTEPRSHP